MIREVSIAQERLCFGPFQLVRDEEQIVEGDLHVWVLPGSGNFYDGLGNHIVHKRTITTQDAQKLSKRWGDYLIKIFYFKRYMDAQSGTNRVGV